MKKKLQLIIDVDGVLTDGSFIYDNKGKIFKKFGPHDSDGIKIIKNFIDVFLISADKRGYDCDECAGTTKGYKGKEVFGPGIIHQYGKPRIYKGNKIAYDTEERKKLWNYSVDLTGKDYR